MFSPLFNSYKLLFFVAVAAQFIKHDIYIYIYSFFFSFSLPNVLLFKKPDSVGFPRLIDTFNSSEEREREREREKEKKRKKEEEEKEEEEEEEKKQQQI